MNRIARRLVALAAVSTVGVLAPVASASAATPVLPSALAYPFPHYQLPALPLTGAGLPAFNLPAGGFAPALTFQGPQVAIGPTVIGSVFNGGTSVVVSTAPPVNSGNVIGSP